MITAWILSIISIMTSLVIILEHSTALQIQLLAIEQEAYTAFVAAEKQLDRCEAQLSNTNVLAALTENDTVVDANAIGNLFAFARLGMP